MSDPLVWRSRLSVTFFASRTLRSRIKSFVVGNYYREWGHIIAYGRRNGGGVLGYVDLFAGPGIYEDGSESTPLMVVRKTLGSRVLSEQVQLVFNDKDSGYVSTLKLAVADLVSGGSVSLRHKPLFFNFEVGSSTLNWFRELGLSSCLFFLDPFGYRGLTMNLIAGLVSEWGSDCIFLFNYSALNKHLHNEGEDVSVAEFWNSEDLESLRAILSGSSPLDSEYRTVGFLSKCLRQRGIPYVLPMRFTMEGSAQTSYHLVLASKHFRAYELMKEVMHKVSTGHVEGAVPFEFVFRNDSVLQIPMLGLRPDDHLHERLFSKFAGRSLTFRDLYRHSEEEGATPFIKRHYVSALDRLRDERLLSGGRRGGIGDHVILRFESLEERERLRNSSSFPEQRALL